MRVAVVGPVNGLGYGVVCVNLVHGLTLCGARPYLRTWPENVPVTQEDVASFPPTVARSLHEAADRYITERPYTVPHLHVWHEWLLGGPWVGKTVGMPFFETEPLLPHAIEPLKRCGKVVVTSAWARDLLVSSGVDAAYVMYAGIDPEVFHPASRPSNRVFTFLHVGKFEIRKGIDILIEAFARVHEKHSNTQLYLLVDNPFHTKTDDRFGWYGETVRLINKAGVGDYVHVLRYRPTHKALAALYRQVDCLVQPSRGEGLGLPALEAAACGTQVVMTDNTGHGAFADKINAHIVPSHGLEPAVDDVFFFADQRRNWRTVKMKDVYEKMCDAIERPKQPTVGKELTWKAGARRLLNFLERI